ncbi:hypothetical protein ACWGDT_29650 [Streptomyces avermitilis]
MAISKWFTEGSNLVSLGALTASALALTRTWSTSRTAKKNLRIAMKQEERRNVQPQVQLLQSRRRVLGDAERYSYLIHIANPADSGHFIARAELSVNYRSRDGVVLAIKIPTERVIEEEVKYLGEDSSLQIPVNVSSRQAIEGWIHFKLAENLISGHGVDRYVVLLETGDGGTLTVESIIPVEI